MRSLLRYVHRNRYPITTTYLCLMVTLVVFLQITEAPVTGYCR